MPSKNWRPSIPNCVCQHCGVTYTARSYGTKYCGQTCKALAHRKPRVEYVTKRCPGCNVEFSHRSKEPQEYCSRECRYTSGAWTKPKTVACAACGALHEARQRNQNRHFCSPRCATEGLRSGEDRICVNCGATFYIIKTRDDRCCSWDCRNEFYQRAKTRPWKGGVVQQGPMRAVLLRRPGYVGKYMGEHRLVASKAIGRPLAPHEPVIHLNRDRVDNRPANLYICRSRSDATKLLHGSLPWPERHNLDVYR